MGANIIAVAEAYTVMTMDMPYHQALSKDAALKTIQQESGRQFHPEVVEAFIEGQVDSPIPVEIPDNAEVANWWIELDLYRSSHKGAFPLMIPEQVRSQPTTSPAHFINIIQGAFAVALQPGRYMQPIDWLVGLHRRFDRA